MFSFEGAGDKRIPVVMRSWETPVPIPNTTVKTRSAEDTWLETTRENRWLPDSILLYIKALRASAPLILNSSAVEQPAVNRWVVGSSPTWGVKWPGGQAVKTRPFHGCNRGSIPRRVIFFSLIWRHSQVVRQRSATPLSIGSNPIGASFITTLNGLFFYFYKQNSDI